MTDTTIAENGAIESTGTAEAAAADTNVLQLTNFTSRGSRRSPGRRSGKDRRDSEGSVQPADSDRRSGKERRSEARSALWAAMRDGEDARHILGSRVVPLLDLCATASRAIHALDKLATQADRDPALQAQLSAMPLGWQELADGEDTVLCIGQCVLMARDLCADMEAKLDSLTADAQKAMERMG